jgi:hypothetical protein
MWCHLQNGGLIKSMTTKATMPRRQSLGGKENSLIDAPAAPTHKISATTSSTAPAGRYDRYGESNAYGQQVPAW